MKKIQLDLYINGTWVESENKEKFNVINPANLEVIGTAAKGSRNDAKKALESAQAAFIKWSATHAETRSTILRKAADLIMAKQDEIARLLTVEHGKPLNEAQGEVKGACNCLLYYADEAKRVSGEIAPSKTASSRSFVIKQPRGVVVAIAPWNYPIALTMWKVAPALATGCTVVVKPPADTPLACLKLLSLISEAGLPAGAINVVTGPSDEVGEELISNPITKVVAFTGSTKVGKHIAGVAGPLLKKLILELGGQTPMVIFDDADFDKAVADGVKRSFRNMGQICNAINRIYVEKDIAKKYIQAFIEATKKLSIGDGMINTKVDLGPMTNPDGIKRSQQHIDDAVQKGARLCYGGKKPMQPELGKGYFFEPTILTDVKDSMLIMNEEVFGPVVAIDTFGGLDEAVKKANSTHYGLVTYVYTSNINTAFKMMEKIESGTVTINSVSPDSLYAPYPAWKDSGIGLENGHYGLEEYLQIKHCVIEIL
jgi:succinate-semialdehyde dehydrogenase/glutarate-semialdehyde dehydrogenase